MELKTSKRDAANKTESKALRRAGNIPAVLYVHGKEGEKIAVNSSDFKKILNQIPSGTLATTIFSLDVGGKKKRAILKDIQYHPTSYEVAHLDFEELNDAHPVTLNIPIQCTGVVDCVGIKLGGSLRQVIRTVKVRCLPKDIPSHFEIDVRELNIGQSKRLSELAIPERVRPMVNTHSVAVVIAKR